MPAHLAEAAPGDGMPVDPYRIESYPPAREEPLCYPGYRPDFSFMTTVNGDVWPIAAYDTSAGKAYFVVDTPEGSGSLDVLLKKNNALPMHDRVPVVGFGSNASPGQLMHKFDNPKYHDLLPNPHDRRIVPTLRGQVDDFVAAYSSRLGIYAYVFAELTAREGARTDLFVNFLSPDQLAVMRKTEAQYELCSLGEITLEGLKRAIPGYGFAGKNPIMLHPDPDPEGPLADLDYCGPRNRPPILLEGISEAGDIPSMSEIKLLSHLALTIGGRLRMLYPKMPPAAEFLTSPELSDLQRAQLLVGITRQRNFFVRRNSATYAHSPDAGEPEDMIFGDAVVRLLKMDRLVAETNLLTGLPAEAVNITPQTFGELYNK